MLRSCAVLVVLATVVNAGMIVLTGLDPALTKGGIFYQIDSTTGAIVSTRYWDGGESTTGKASSITYDAINSQFVSMNWNGQNGLLQTIDKDSFNIKTVIRNGLPWVNDFVYDENENLIIGDFCAGWTSPLYLQYITIGNSSIQLGTKLSDNYWPVIGRGWYVNMTVYDSQSKTYYGLVGDFNHGDYRKIVIGSLQSIPAKFSVWDIPNSDYVLQQFVWSAVDNKLYAVAAQNRYFNPKLQVWDNTNRKFVDILPALGANYMYGPAVVGDNGSVMLFVRKDTSGVRNYELWELNPSRGTQQKVKEYSSTTQIFLRAAFAATN